MNELDAVRERLAKLRANRLERQTGIAQLASKAHATTDLAERGALLQRLAAARSELSDLRSQELDGPALALDPRQLLGALRSDLPILLMPLRVQTRFHDGQAGRELMVRVYPDDISVQTLDRELTASEKALGDAFWATAEHQQASPAPPTRIEVWRGLVAQVGMARATYIRRATDPDNALPQAGPRQAGVWTLPERLVFLCQGKEFIGNVIPDGLEAGFDPSLPGAGFSRPEGDSGEFEAPPEMAWQFDFDTAVTVGMAIRIPLDQVGNPRRIDRLVVLGVRMGNDERASADLLARLIADHQHTEGFELVPQGTPSNVTQEGEARPSVDADTLDTVLGPEGAYTADVSRLLHSDEPDGLRLARALGLDPEVLRHVPFAGTRDGAEAIAMKRALWAGTLGYNAQQLLSPLFEDGSPLRVNNHIGERTLLTTRFFFTTFVFGRGPLPAVRVGAQPYGILPVSADMLGPLTNGFATWGEDFVDAFTGALHGKLQILARVWQDLARTQAASIGKGQLAEVLSLQASSVEYRISRLVGTEYLANYVNFKNETTGKAEMEKLATLLQQRWQAFNALCPGLIGGQPFLSSLTFMGGVWRRILADVTRFDRVLSTPLPGDLIDNLPLSESRSIAGGYPNYIGWLSERNLLEVRRGLTRPGADGKPEPVTALLYQMLRHSHLYEHVFAAMRLVHHAQGTHWAVFREKEMVNLSFALDRTHWDLLEQASIRLGRQMVSPLALMEGDTQSRERLPLQREKLGDVDDLKIALRQLARLPTARLERLFAEHLDLCGHRLDAWLTGFVYQRLLGQRLMSAQPRNHPLFDLPNDQRSPPLRYDLDLRPLEPSRGLYLGAFGFVDGLEADAPGEPVRDLPDALTPKNGGAVTRDPDNAGLIHAPSLNHAVTAAILRSGSISEPGTEAFNIELSSARTRDALWMIEGIRNGQLPAALLGYRFERGLREAGPALQQHLPSLRGTFPMPRPPETQPDDPLETVPPRDVVNGLAIVQALRETRLDAALATINPGLPTEAQTAVRRLAAEITGLLDACGDLMLAESVHQAAQGNLTRAGAAVTAAGEFSHVPDRFDAVQTPRSGTLVTHRLLLAFDTAATAAGPLTPRARIAPALNAWVAGLLGPLETTVFSIDYRGDAESPAGATSVLLPQPIPAGHMAEPPLASFRFNLSQLGLAPLDMVYLLDDASGTELARRADLLARPLFEAARADAGFSRIELQCFGDAAPGQRTVGELMPLAAQLRQLVGRARSATRRDLVAPKELHADAASRDALEAIDADALQLAVMGAVGDAVDPTGLLLVAEATAAKLASAAALDQAELTAVLLDAAAFGLPEAVPVLVPNGPVGNEQQMALRNQARQVAVALQARADTARSQATEALLKSDRLSVLNDAVKTLLGSVLPLLPLPLVAQDLSAAELPAGAPSAERIEDWLFAASLVREGTRALQHVRTLGAAAGATLEPLRVVQWPATARTWIAEPRALVDGKPEDWGDDRVALVLQGGTLLDLSQPMVSLLVDEWTELLPNPVETTGVAFHYDAPNSEPPQSLLLAVSTRALERNGQWSWGELVQCVEKSFMLAQMRVVGPDELRQTPLDLLLPATAMAESAAPVTVSTSLLSAAVSELATLQHAIWSNT